MTTIAVPPRRISPQRTLRHGLTLAWRNVAQLKHSPEKLLDTTLTPVVFLLLFLYVFGGAVAGDTHSYLQQLLPGLVAQMTFIGTMGLGVALNEDIHKGVFDRFRSLPIARSAPLVGSVLGETIKFCVMMTMLVGFGVILGFRFDSDPLSIVAALALAYVFFLAVCWIFVLVGLLAPSPESVQGIGFILVMPLTFGSSVLMPNIGTMPGWLQAWVKVNPVTHLAESLRALMIGGPMGNHAWYTLAWAAGIVLVTFPLALRLYARRT
ncbi:ABC transporter permease [Actinomadura sp. 6N118]|uniref:ABC transporter permease n=1 Tax=Actinomadura sp. 6N118 TaxID=3375151 RepID=UPI0037B80318